MLQHSFLSQPWSSPDSYYEVLAVPPSAGTAEIEADFSTGPGSRPTSAYRTWMDSSEPPPLPGCERARTGGAHASWLTSRSWVLALGAGLAVASLPAPWGLADALLVVGLLGALGSRRVERASSRDNRAPNRSTRWTAWPSSTTSQRAYEPTATVSCDLGGRPEPPAQPSAVTSLTRNGPDRRPPGNGQLIRGVGKTTVAAP